MTSPRTHALRFRIWAHCQPLGWDTTVPEIAVALDEPLSAIAGAIAATGWTHRLRANARTSRDRMDTISATRYRAAELTVRDVLSGRIGVSIDA